MKTDAWAFLNIRNPVCAWAAYRSTLVSMQAQTGALSVWSASLLRDTKTPDFARELALEAVRLRRFPQRISRLTGMFCFLDRADAMKAAIKWHDGQNHFQERFLAEINLSEAGQERDRLDSNWITNAAELDRGPMAGDAWMSRYWTGDPYPDADPVWETLVHGRMFILGTEIREQARTLLKKHLPDSLSLAEIGRLAAWVGSDLGAISAFLLGGEGTAKVIYCINMVDAENPIFLKRLEDLIHGQKHPVDWDAIGPHFKADRIGVAPDLRPWEFTVDWNNRK